MGSLFDFDNMRSSPLGTEGQLLEESSESSLHVTSGLQTDVYYQHQLQLNRIPQQELHERISSAHPVLKTSDTSVDPPPVEVNFFAQAWPAIDLEAEKLTHSRKYRREATLKWRNKRLIQEQRRHSQQRQCELSSKRSPNANETGSLIPSLKSVRALERKRSNGRFVATTKSDTDSISKMDLCHFEPHTNTLPTKIPTKPPTTISFPVIAATSNDLHFDYRSNIIDDSKLKQQDLLPSTFDQGLLRSTSSMGDDSEYIALLSFIFDDCSSSNAAIPSFV